VGVSSQNFFPGDVPRGRGDKMGITFGRPAPWNLGGQKIVQHSARFLTTFDFDREYLRNASTKNYLINHDHLQVGRKKLRELWSTNELFTHPRGHFSGDYISAVRGCRFLKFLHTLQIDQALLAHTPTGMGVTPKNFNRENLKFGLKFSVWASITSGLVGVLSRNFSRRRAARQGW